MITDPERRSDNDKHRGVRARWNRRRPSNPVIFGRSPRETSAAKADYRAGHPWYGPHRLRWLIGQAVIWFSLLLIVCAIVGLVALPDDGRAHPWWASPWLILGEMVAAVVTALVALPLVRKPCTKLAAVTREVRRLPWPAAVAGRVGLILFAVAVAKAAGHVYGESYGDRLIDAATLQALMIMMVSAVLGGWHAAIAITEIGEHLLAALPHKQVDHTELIISHPAWMTGVVSAGAVGLFWQLPRFEAGRPAAEEFVSVLAGYVAGPVGYAHSGWVLWGIGAIIAFAKVGLWVDSRGAMIDTSARPWRLRQLIGANIGPNDISDDVRGRVDAAVRQASLLPCGWVEDVGRGLLIAIIRTARKPRHLNTARPLSSRRQRRLGKHLMELDNLMQAHLNPAMHRQVDAQLTQPRWSGRVDSSIGGNA